jgi:hypothetical protein
MLSFQIKNENRTIETNCDDAGITQQAIAEKWKRMKRQIDPELSLWTFSTPSEDWKARTGMLGIALFRHDEFLSHVTLAWD